MAKNGLQQCPACQGRRTVPNVKTGAPEVCPLCQGGGVLSAKVDPLSYWYIINTVAIAAAAGSFDNGALRIESRSDFELVWMMATSTGGTFTTEFTDSSGRTWQNLPVNNVNQFGTAVSPFPMIVPVVLKAESVLTWRIVNTSGNINTVQLALVGNELYPVESR